MIQDERWLEKYQEVITFIGKNERNPSKYKAEERGRYLNWIKHNRKLYVAGEMKSERADMFKGLLEIIEKNKHVNQYA